MSKQMVTKKTLGSLIDGTLEWSARAGCIGAAGSLFFPERGESTHEAKAICRRCEVRAECLDYALSAGEKFGIWGGLSERERRRVRRQRFVA